MTEALPRRVLTLVLSFCALLYAASAFAADEKIITARATGAVTSQSLCGTNLVCQTTVVSGTATYLGRLTGVLEENVDITTGLYSGTAIFTTSGGDTISTEYVGQVSPPDATGTSYFAEEHDVVDATGRFVGATGNLSVLGTASATLQISIVATGSLIK